jgi:hypothetical protein
MLALPMLLSKNVLVLDASPERDPAAEEVSDERFDRTEFALQALDLIRPQRITVAVCEGAARTHVAVGRRWGHPGEAWAMLAIPRYASRRSIALAVAELSGVPPAWALDVLLGHGHGRGHVHGRSDVSREN